MADSQLKSKLKRRKSSAEELQADMSARAPPGRGRSPLSSSGSAAKTDGSAVPAAAWWNRRQLPAVENLWAFTLKSALPYLENQRWDLVPDLPHPPAAAVKLHLCFFQRAAGLTLDEQRWCDLSGEVAPFPEPRPPSPRTSPSLLGLSPSQRDLSVHTTPVPHPPDRQPSAHSRRSPNRQTTSPRPPGKRQRLSPLSWEEAGPSAGPSGGGEAARRREEVQVVSRKLVTERGSDGGGPLLEEEEHEGVTEDEEEVRRSATRDGGGGGGLQSCPMCLQVFPAGFTQMDCDSHLAQCLSEMNVDMTW